MSFYSKWRKRRTKVHARRAADAAETVARETTLRAADARIRAHPNPISRMGTKCYSQNDEDGITLDILRRLNIENGTFLEFGVEDGIENNTLVLLAAGWRGGWVGGSDLAFDIPEGSPLCYRKGWVDRDNITALVGDALAPFADTPPQLISMDLDGNDIHFVSALLEAGHRPAVWITEYNAKFPPPVRFALPYAADHTWQGDDWFGTSLQSYIDLFDSNDYQLVACNAATGSNAYFVRRDLMGHAFDDVPQDPRQIWAAPHYVDITPIWHRPSLRLIKHLVAKR
ncbi:hypothetical protein [uncultured Tateyamaria sp.]|uniref:hypothetical protein n=1 Tax=uncultured Tateyamaria sp. TaxID=455651 RepID=UPI0026054F8C|nr:hypothetical protein [uncultured Tateyamaria sp.]